MKKLILATLISLGGCDLSTQEAVEYTFSCEQVQCKNHGGSWEYVEGDYKAFNCIWHCNEYKGKSSRYVDVTFVVGDDGCWYEESVFVSNGVCEYDWSLSDD